MHRVELKDDPQGLLWHAHHTFLMHRVELKEGHSIHTQLCILVPNAPCGVERQLFVSLSLGLLCS